MADVMIGKALILINLAASLGALLWVFFIPSFESIVTSLALAATLAVSIREYMTSQSLRSVDKFCRIVFLGFLGSGKTTYIAALFTEMQQVPREDIWFAFSDD